MSVSAAMCTTPSASTVTPGSEVAALRFLGVPVRLSAGVTLSTFCDGKEGLSGVHPTENRRVANMGVRARPDLKVKDMPPFLPFVGRDDGAKHERL